jgi:hypothetical protein
MDMRLFEVVTYFWVHANKKPWLYVFHNNQTYEQQILLYEEKFKENLHEFRISIASIKTLYSINLQ